PKIVRVRLNSPSNPLGGHPDADLLTAFAEHSIGHCERAQVMQQLANCGDCREVISLAQPQIENLIVRHSSDPIAWLSSPVLRWVEPKKQADRKGDFCNTFWRKISTAFPFREKGRSGAEAG